MWKANLNRHFQKLLPALKVSIFMVLWNALFHSFTLSILLFWTLTSNRVSELNRMGTLNQFLSENQILFAALASFSALAFFRTSLHELWQSRRLGLPELGKSFIRGAGFGAALILALILNREYEFLGFSTQLNLNFLAAYAWILRSVLIFFFVFSTEFLVRVILHEELSEVKYRLLVENLNLLLIYWIWFSPKPGEALTLILLFGLFPSFWASTGFLSAFFILIHAIFGLNFFENESLGVLQLKLTHSEETLLQNGHLQALLFILLASIQYVRIKPRKETAHP
jgi:hypothetical protein